MLAVNWGQVATTSGAVATVLALVIFPVLLWVNRRGHDWMTSIVEEASEAVIERLVTPRLNKVEDSVHKLRGNIGEIAGRVSYLEGLEAGLSAQGSLRVTQHEQRTRSQATKFYDDDEDG